LPRQMALAMASTLVSPPESSLDGLPM
jgi:hypothetical protein